MPTYNDYPKSASNNAKKAIAWKEKNGSSCGTAVGWTRARQLADRKNISRETISRMASFKRHQQHKDVPYSEGCGGIMWDAWGGTSGVEWAIAKLKKLKMSADRISHKNAFRQARATEAVGVMSEVSLIQAGEAKGHGVYVDRDSLQSALEIAPNKIPAFLTHNGALESDRILQQVGFFKDFYIDEDRLMAKQFVALESFKKDEPEKYNRLFDIATEIPETFGISLVFENELFWALKDGTFKKFAEDEKPKDSKYDMPVVRFVEIYSADFVDEPACNEKGLFKALTKYNSHIMTEDEKNTDTDATTDAELEAENIALAAEDTIEDTESDESSEEETEAEAEGSPEEASLDLMAELAEGLQELSLKVDALVATQASHGDALGRLTTLNKLGLAKRITPKANNEDVAEKVMSVKDRYMKMNGSELINFTKNNSGDLKKALLKR